MVAEACINWAAGDRYVGNATEHHPANIAADDSGSIGSRASCVGLAVLFAPVFLFADAPLHVLIEGKVLHHLHIRHDMLMGQFIIILHVLCRLAIT